MAGQALDELIGNIGKSIKQALHAMDEYSLETFMQQFESVPGAAGEPPKLVPKTVQVPIPKGDGTYSVRAVPRAALLHHSSLQLEDLHINMKVAISPAEGGAGERQLLTEVGPAVAAKDQSGDKVQPNMADISVTFKRGHPPEGVARLYTEFNKVI